jgi:hypothetical protein
MRLQVDAGLISKNDAALLHTCRFLPGLLVPKSLEQAHQLKQAEERSDERARLIFVKTRKDS